MTALAASDLTCVVTDAAIIGNKRFQGGTLAFGNGALTYPTGGIALPAIGSFGFVRQMDSLQVTGVNGLTYDFDLKWDKTNAKLQLFGTGDAATADRLPEVASTVAPAARTYTWRALGW